MLYICINLVTTAQVDSEILIENVDRWKKNGRQGITDK